MLEMAAVVFIASVRDVSLRIGADFVGWNDFENIQHERVHLLPPVLEHEVQWPGWLLTSAASGGVQLPSCSHTMGKQEVQLIGLARVTLRGMKMDQGPLTTWDQEGTFLRQLYRQPLDGCLVKVIDAVLFETPVPITRRQPSTRAGLISHKDVEARGRALPRVTADPRQQIFVPCIPTGSEFKLQGGAPVSDKLAQWGTQRGLC